MVVTKEKSSPLVSKQSRYGRNDFFLQSWPSLVYQTSLNNNLKKWVSSAWLWYIFLIIRVTLYKENSKPPSQLNFRCIGGKYMLYLPKNKCCKTSLTKEKKVPGDTWNMADFCGLTFSLFLSTHSEIQCLLYIGFVS